MRRTGGNFVSSCSTLKMNQGPKKTPATFRINLLDTGYGQDK